MLVDLQIAVNPRALDLNGRSMDEAIEEANRELAIEAKKHFGAGKILVGRLDDGRFYFRHIALGTMVRIPDELAVSAADRLRSTVIPAVRVMPVEGGEPVAGVHGIWARQSWVDQFMEGERLEVSIAS